MNLRKRQLGFLLNPYRFTDTTANSGALFVARGLSTIVVEEEEEEVVSPIDPNDILVTLDADLPFADQPYGNVQAMGASPEIENIPETGIHGPVMSNGETMRFGKVVDPTDSTRNAFLFQVVKEDPTTSDGKRVEFKIDNNIEWGETYWIAYSLYIYDWGTLSVEGNSSLFGTQCHTGSTTSVGGPSFSTYARQNSRFMNVEHRFDTAPFGDGTTTTTRSSERPIPFGQWLDFVIKFRHDTSGTSSGLLQVWIDGVQTYDFTGDLGYDTGEIDYMKFGYYNFNSTMQALIPRKLLERNPTIVHDPGGSTYTNTEIATLLVDDEDEETPPGAVEIEVPDTVFFEGAASVGSSATLSSVGSSSMEMANSQSTQADFEAAAASDPVFAGSADYRAAFSVIADSRFTGSYYGNEWILQEGAQFDGTNDHIKRGSAFTFPVSINSKAGIISFWYKMSSFTATDGSVVLETSNKGNIRHLSTRRLRFQFPMFTMDVNQDATTGVWYHILASWNHDGTSRLHLYRDDVDVKSVVVAHTGASFNWASILEWKIGWLGSTNALKFNGAISAFYFAPGQYLDFSDVANRRRFISANGIPIEMGATGSIPTGSSPLIFLNINTGNAANDFAINRSTDHGNMTVIGSLDVTTPAPPPG